MSEDDTAWADESVPLYALTAGRTRPDHGELDLATLVRAAPGIDAAVLEPEHTRILGLCPTWQAVAEIAAGLGVPLVVAKIQLCDLIGRRALTISAPSRATATPITRATLQRVLHGLRAI